MPTYSYRCTMCGDAFDIQQSFTDANLTICPACGGALRKVFSPVGVSFTGSGFYRNDSRAKPEGEKTASKAGGTASSNETKPEKAAPAAKETTTTSTPSTGTVAESGKKASKEKG